MEINIEKLKESIDADIRLIENVEVDYSKSRFDDILNSPIDKCSSFISLFKRDFIEKLEKDIKNFLIIGDFKKNSDLRSVFDWGIKNNLKKTNFQEVFCLGEKFPDLNKEINQYLYLIETTLFDSKVKIEDTDFPYNNKNLVFYFGWGLKERRTCGTAGFSKEYAQNAFNYPHDYFVFSV